jgi:ankyrin repeat protein
MRQINVPATKIKPRVSPNQCPNVTACVSKKRPKNDVHPVLLLRAILKKSGIQSANKTCHGSFFSKPDDKDISSYDLEVVNAIRGADIDTLRTLHKKGKSMNACNRFGESILHMCCRRGDAKLVRFLVEEMRVRTNVKDDYGRTPLHDACWTSSPNVEILEILIKNCHKDLLLAPDVRGHTPLDYARKEHWGVWYQFFNANRELLK